MRVRGKLWRSFGRKRYTDAAVDLRLPQAHSDDLDVEPPQLIVAPTTEETITLYAAPPPHRPLLDTGGSKDATEKMAEEAKVRRSIGNQEIAMEDAKTVTEEGERSKVMRGQQKMRRRHLYNEDEEEEKQRRKVEEEEENRKKVEAEMRERLKVEEEQRTRRTSPSHRFPSSVRAESIYR